MSSYYRKASSKGPTLLICFAIFLAGAAWFFCANDSTGATADEWTFYEDDVQVTGVTWEPTHIEWKQGSDVQDFIVTSTYDATKDIVTLHYTGLIKHSTPIAGTVVISDDAQPVNNIKEVAFNVTVNESSTGLMVMLVAALALVAGVWTLIRK